ncbi:MAG: 30S ribosomal protein S5 [Malacoplasma sp.]|nr:30S ribosomal protein S5 [Malacoplasma sp.]
MEENKQQNNANQPEKKSEQKQTENKKVFVKPNSGNVKPYEKDKKFFSNKDQKNKANQSSDSSKPSGFKSPNSTPRFQKQTRPSTTGFEEKIVSVKKISKTTKGGRNMRFSALAVIGDKKGMVGFGIGKSIEVPVAIKKALKAAKNNMFKVKMNKNFTVYYEVIGKHGAGKVLIKPAPKGTGVIAGGPIKVVLELSGFSDVYSKNLGCNTPLNMVRATIKGLLMQKSPREFAALRDKTLNQIWGLEDETRKLTK